MQDLKEYESGEREYRGVAERFVRTGQGKAETERRGYADFLAIDFDSMAKENADLVGWLHIPKTKISYPVVQGSDNAYYLKRDFHKNGSVYGAIFADCEVEDLAAADNVGLYGHNMKNGAMFGGLKKYLQEDYYEDHKEIHFYTKEAVYIYEVFTVYTAKMDDEEAYKLTVGTENLPSYQVAMKKRCDFQTSSDVDGGNILTLSTCHGSRGTTIRCLVQAARTAAVEYGKR